MALLPLAIVSWQSHSQAVDALHTETLQKLSTALALKSNALEFFFSEKIKDLQVQALERDNIRFIQELRTVWQTSNTPAETFVQSFSWSEMAEQEGGELKEFIETYQYKNLFLMEPGGEILFSVYPDSLLGNNLLTGTLKNSPPYEAVIRAMEQKKTIFSDVERQDSGATSGYLVRPMIAETGETVGVLLLQLSLEPIFAILENHAGFGTTYESYLVGQDLLMRSNSRFKKTSTIGLLKIDTAITRQWRQDVTARAVKPPSSTPSDNSPIKIMPSYTDYDGHEVIGSYTDLAFMAEIGVYWGLISELDSEEFLAPSIQLRNEMIIALLLTAFLVLLAAGGVARHIVTPLQRLTHWARRIQDGELEQESIPAPTNEIGTLVTAFGSMTATLITTHAKNQHNLWLKQGSAELNRLLRGEKELAELGNETISFLAAFLGAQAGAFYTMRSKGGMILTGSFALPMDIRTKNLTFAPGEGVVGQCLLEKKPLNIHSVPPDYFRIQSGLGDGEPRHLLIFPCLLDDQVEAMIELGSFDPFTDWHLDFLTQEAKSMAMAVAAVHSRTLLRRTLEHSQEQAKALEKISEAMRHSNDELQAQTKALQTSEALLQQQQEELRVSNEELEAHAQMLEEKNQSDQRQNAALQAIRQELEQKAIALEQSSRYKSEFLSNMSHELRTPLNSLLILSNSFAENEEGNLSSQQVEDARIIYNSGKDLLGLINEILDLAKIEAGRMTLHVDTMHIREFATEMERNFKHVAVKQGVAFHLDIPDTGLPETLNTDQEKMTRILKNLLSNAFKFTSQGSVTLGFAPAPTDWIPKNGRLDSPYGQSIAMRVTDTGIGIPAEKHAIIFEAFQQADGSTSRQFGGTGLGLSISTQLANLLGGEIQLTSQEGEGSAFTLLLPQLSTSTNTQTATSFPPPKTPLVPKATTKPATPAIPDDRETLQPGERVMLIIEDDPNFARIVAQFAHEQGFKYLAAADGQSGLDLACTHQPTGIILDIGLPILDGWSVMEQLKENPATRHIPVHIMSAGELGMDGLSKGAASQFVKPVSKANIQEAFLKTDRLSGNTPNTLLLVDGDLESRQASLALLEGQDVQITQATTGQEALNLLAANQFDCLVLELSLPDMACQTFLEQLSAIKSSNPPIVIYSQKKLTPDEFNSIKLHTNTVIEQDDLMRELLLLSINKNEAQGMVIKEAQSPERLLDEVALFLHRVERDLPPEKRQMIKKLHDPQEVFKNKTILVVDDDVRNAYALGRQLERKEFTIRMAVNGEKAIAALKEHTDIDCVLMDIMMPIMDGYEAIRQIRQQPRFQNLPIIALTAKAMEEDRRQCMAAGANDYLAKPVDMSKLLAMLRIWLYR